MFDMKMYNAYNETQYSVNEAVRHFCEGYDPETGRVTPIMLGRVRDKFDRIARGDNDGPRFVGPDNPGDIEFQVAFMFFRSTLMNLGVPMEHIVAAAKAE